MIQLEEGCKSATYFRAKVNNFINKNGDYISKTSFVVMKRKSCNCVGCTDFYNLFKEQHEDYGEVLISDGEAVDDAIYFLSAEEEYIEKNAIGEENYRWQFKFERGES